MGIERRKDARIRIGLKATYRIVGKKFSSRKVLAFGKVSISGVQIKVSKKLSPGTTLELNVKFPETNKATTFSARVVFVSKNARGEYPPYSCGLEFVEVKEADRLYLKNLINEAMGNLNWEFLV